MASISELKDSAQEAREDSSDPKKECQETARQTAEPQQEIQNIARDGAKPNYETQPIAREITESDQRDMRITRLGIPYYKVKGNIPIEHWEKALLGKKFVRYDAPDDPMVR